MPDYGRRMREGSREYQLGRLGRKPFDMHKWNDTQISDYQRGTVDQARKARGLRRKVKIERIVSAPIIAVMVVILVLAAAIYRALPLILILLLAWVLFH